MAANVTTTTPESAETLTDTETTSYSRVQAAPPDQPRRSRAYAFHTSQHSIETHLPPAFSAPTHFSCRAIFFDTQIKWTSQTCAPPRQPSGRHQGPEIRNDTPNHFLRRTRAPIYQVSHLYVEAMYHPPQSRRTESTDASHNSRFKSHTVWELLTNEGSSHFCEQEDEDWSTITKPFKKLQSRNPISKAETHRCVECYRRWTLEESTEQWYRDKGWPIPKRCQPCRNRRKDRASHNKLKARKPFHIHQVSLGSKKGWNALSGEDHPAEKQKHHSAPDSSPTPSSPHTPSPPRGSF